MGTRTQITTDGMGVGLLEMTDSRIRGHDGKVLLEGLVTVPQVLWVL